MISKFSVKRPYTVFVAVVLIIVLGVISFLNLSTDLLPNIELPYIIVMTSYPGASPEEVEMVVSKPIEQVLATTSNIKSINSVSSENSSTVILEFESDVNMDSAMIEIDGSLDMVKSAWNDEVGSPIIMKLNPDMMPIMVSAVDVEGMDSYEVSEYVENVIIPELESVEGVASVSGSGLVEESLEVRINPDKIESLNDKMLEQIDGELSEVGNQLDSAKVQVESGLEELESQYQEQSAEIAKGQEAIEAGREQLEAAKSELDSNEDQLKSQKKLLETTLDVLDYSDEELTAMSLQLKQLGDSATDEQLQLLDVIDEIMAASPAERAEMKVQTYASISSIDQGLDQIQEQRDVLLTKEDELAEQESALLQGKMTLDSEIDKAKSELEKGAVELDEQIEEFEASREEAFKNADLEGAITESMISGILTAQNFSMPAGYIVQDGSNIMVKVGDELTSKEDLENLLLFDTGVEGVGKVYLKDVADIVDVDNRDEFYAKINGKDGVVLSMQKQSNYSTAEVSGGIRDKIDEIISNNADVSITNLMDQGVYIDLIVQSVLRNLLSGAALAMLILMFFLKDFKPTLVISLSIPISLVFAITMMYFSGISMNIISLGGLALGVGMLVDNSIVVIENVYRLRSRGMTAIEASIQGAKEVAGAITASTLTTVAVFLPVVFVQGISRQIFTDMGLTIAFSLIASLIIALTLVPVMTSKAFGNIKDKEHRFYDRIQNFYDKAVRTALNHKVIAMSIVIAALIFSAVSAASLGTAFIPEMDGTQMSVTIQMDNDSSMDDLKETTDEVVDRIMNIEGIESVGALSNSQLGQTSNQMSLYLLLDEDKSISNSEISDLIKSSTKDIDAEISVSASNMDLTSMTGAAVEVVIKGREIDTFKEIAEDVAEMAGEVEGIVNIQTSFDDNDSTELRISVDKEKAMEKGLTVAQVYSQVSDEISEGKKATTLSIDNRDYPVIVVDGDKGDLTGDNIDELELTVGNSDDKVLLGDIAEVKEAQTLSSINREDQERYVAVTGELDTGYNVGLVNRELEEKLEDYDVPEGYTVELAGEDEMINETLSDLVMMILLAVVFIYLIMVAQFQSLLSPFIVMFTIPLAFTGGLLALFVTRNEISMISMLGFLVLSGVVVNNGIVFVDYANQMRERGMSKREALVETGKVRMRPILMTAITTILGLLTLSIGVGTGAEMLQPLGIVTIGGLLYATLLTLFIVPVMYEVFVREK